MRQSASRRKFFRSIVAAGALAGGSPAVGQETGRIRGFDHVALPMLHSDEMLAFYRGLGLQVIENPRICSVYFGDQVINFHRPTLWQDEKFLLRAPAAKPPCGDLCLVWTEHPNLSWQCWIEPAP